MSDDLHWDAENIQVTVMLTQRVLTAAMSSVYYRGDNWDDTVNRLIWRGAQVIIPMASGKRVALKRAGSDSYEFIKDSGLSPSIRLRRWVNRWVNKAFHQVPLNVPPVKITFLALEQTWLAIEEVARLQGTTKTDAINCLILWGAEAEKWLSNAMALYIVSRKGRNWFSRPLNLE